MEAGVPLANLLSHMESQGFKGRPGEMLTAGNIVCVMRDSLTLLGNTMSYSNMQVAIHLQYKLSVTQYCKIPLGNDRGMEW